MQISWKKLKGKYAKLSDGHLIGYLNDIYIFDNTIVAFEILKTNLLFNTKLIARNIEVEAINNDLIIVNDVFDNLRICDGIRGSDIIFKEVVEENGNFLGILNDLVFDSQSFRILKFEIVGSLFSLLKNEKIILDPEEIILKEEKILS